MRSPVMLTMGMSLGIVAISASSLLAQSSEAKRSGTWIMSGSAEQAHWIINAQDGGWFGVQLDPPGEALDAQLELNSTGLVVRNICENSPAKQAGLRRFDVIVRFADESVPNESAQLAKRIFELGASTEVELQVKRAGVDVHLSTKLGKRPEKWQWLYPHEPEAVVHKDIVVRSHFIRIDESGQYVLEDMGDPAQHTNHVQSVISKMIPQFKQARSRVWNEDGVRRRVSSLKGEEGTLEIELVHTNGPVIVRKASEGAEQANEFYYASLSEFADQDEEAFKTYYTFQAEEPGSAISSGVLAQLQAAAIQMSNASAEANEEDCERIDGVVDDALHSLGVQYEQALSQYSSALAELTRAQRQLSRLNFSTKTMSPVGPMSLGVVPVYQIRTAADGVITLTVREGDMEVVTSFNDAKQLCSKSPVLCERLSRVQASPVSE